MLLSSIHWSALLCRMRHIQDLETYKKGLVLSGLHPLSSFHCYFLPSCLASWDLRFLHEDKNHFCLFLQSLHTLLTSTPKSVYLICSILQVICLCQALQPCWRWVQDKGPRGGRDDRPFVICLNGGRGELWFGRSLDVPPMWGDHELGAGVSR